MNNNLAIVIVAFNDSRLIAKQIDCFNLFCQDSYDIFIVDNSDIENASLCIKKLTDENNCFYIRTNSLDKDFSVSHSSACNFAYSKLKEDYEYFLFLDHDNFPIKPFSVKLMLGKYKIAGIPQSRIDKIYFWAGFVMFNNKLIDSIDIDFSINREFGLDTGGNLYKLVNKLSCQDFHFFNEVHVPIPNFDFEENNTYALLANGRFQHNIKSSNWNNSPNHEYRINKLYEVLEKNIANGRNS